MFNYINNIIIGIEKIGKFFKHIYELITNIAYAAGPVEVGKDIFVRKRLTHTGYEVLRHINVNDAESKILFEHIKYIKNLKEI